jgi:hypothetical protein
MAVIMQISEKELKKKNPKVVMNPNLDEILKIIRSKEFKAVELTAKDRYNSLSTSLEIDWDPKDPASWLLSFLFVPDQKKPDHWHIDVPLDKIKALHKLLSNIIAATDKLPRKKARKVQKKSKKRNK